MEKLIFIGSIAIYTILYAIYFFAFKKKGKGIENSRYVILAILVVGSLAVGYFSALLTHSSNNSYIWGIALFGVGLVNGIVRFARL